MSFSYYSYLILLPETTDITIEAYKNALEEFYADDEREIIILLENGQITLSINMWEMYITYSDEPHVVLESEELAAEYANGSAHQGAIATSATRFETHAMDDPDMEFFNDSLYVQEVAEGLGEVYIFDPQGDGFANL